MGRPAIRTVLTVVICAVAAQTARGSEQRYRLEIPDGADSAFEVQFRAENPGILAVTAEWDGPRIVSFRLDGPGEPAVPDRRSGPSPQRMEVAVDEEILAEGGGFKLTIRAPAGRGAASGTILVELPDPPRVIEERRKAEEPPKPPPRVREPWTLPARAPTGASPDVQRLFLFVERFRALVVSEDGGVAFDACGWRSELLQRLCTWRDEAALGRSSVSESTLRYLRRVVEAVRDVDTLRTSKESILAGPAPEDPLRRRAWLQVRAERIRPIERQLDALPEMLRGGHAPDLEKEIWTPRLLACLTACERSFDGRALAEEGEDPVNADLARAQWSSILAAADALSSLPATGTAPP